MNPSPQLIEYIKNSLTQSVSKQQIIDTLLNVGWDKQSIDLAFEQVEKDTKIQLTNNNLQPQNDLHLNTNIDQGNSEMGSDSTLNIKTDEKTTKSQDFQNNLNLLDTQSSISTQDSNINNEEDASKTNIADNKPLQDNSNNISNLSNDEKTEIETINNKNQVTTESNLLDGIEKQIKEDKKQTDDNKNNNQTPPNQNEKDEIQALKQQLEDATKIKPINDNNVQDLSNTNVTEKTDQIEGEKKSGVSGLNIINKIQTPENKALEYLGPRINEVPQQIQQNLKQKQIQRRKNLIIKALIGLAIGLGILGVMYLGLNFYYSNQSPQQNIPTPNDQDQQQEQQIQQQVLQTDSKYLVVFTTTQEYNYPTQDIQMPETMQIQNQDQQNSQGGENEQQNDITSMNINQITMQTQPQDISNNQQSVLGDMDTSNVPLSTKDSTEELPNIKNNTVELENSLNTNTVGKAVNLVNQDQTTQSNLSPDAELANDVLQNNTNNTQPSNIGSVLSDTDIDPTLLAQQNLQQNSEQQQQNNQLENTEQVDTQQIIQEINQTGAITSTNENNMSIVFYDLRSNTNLKVSDTILRDNNFLYSLGNWSPDGRYLPIMGLANNQVTNSQSVNVYLYDAQQNSASKIYTEQYQTAQSIIKEFGFNTSTVWIDENNFKLVPDQDATISSKRVTAINTIGEISTTEQNKVQTISINNITFKYNENTKGIEGNIMVNNEPIDYETKPNDYFLSSTNDNIVLLNKGENQSSIIVINIQNNIVTSYPIIFDNWNFASAQFNNSEQNVIIHLVDNLDYQTKERYVTLNINNGEFRTLFEQDNNYIEYMIDQLEFYKPQATFVLAGDDNYVVSKRAYSTIITQGVDIYAKNITNLSEREVCSIVCDDYVVFN